MKLKIKSFAKFWLLSLSSLAVLTSFYEPEIERHDLTRVLHFGYDAFGRNCFFLSLAGAFESMKAILLLSVFCLLLALFLSFMGTSIDQKFKFFWESFIDTLSSLPGFLIALALSVFLKNQTETLLLASLFLVLPFLIRFFENQIRTLQMKNFMDASVAIGSNHFQRFRLHVYPELRDSVINILPFLFTRLLFIETSLSFLGISQTEEIETWGKLMLQGKNYLLEAPWIFILGGAPLCLTLLALHALGHEPDSGNLKIN